MDAAKEKREMEQKHSTIQQKVWGNSDRLVFVGMLVNAATIATKVLSVASSVNHSLCEK